MVKYWTYSTLIIWILKCQLVNCQNQDNPVGAHRFFRKTGFSCGGRPAGYYADIETGCQIYHMCDGLGRQFSYSCPNTTLFQQRMLICDHWYMVNCSKAESDYDANLLIGQRDKPFVSDSEHQLRTPRPDLLDRPYAPDYSGESFRNQYRPSIPNHLDDLPDDFDDSQLQLRPPPSSTRWRITQPSREIEPPAVSPIAVAIRRMDDNENSDLGASFSSNYNSSADIASEEDYSLIASSESPTTRVFQNSIPSQTTKTYSSSFHTTRPTIKQHISRHSTRHRIITTSTETLEYKSPSPETTFPTLSSNQFGTRSKEAHRTSPTRQPILQQNANKLEPEIKVPSRLYEPPYLYPIYNSNYSAASFGTSTATAFKAAATFSTTKAPPLNRPTTSAGRPFTHTSTTPNTAISDFILLSSSQQSETLQQAESSNPTRNTLNNFDFTRPDVSTVTDDNQQKRISSKRPYLQPPPPPPPQTFQRPILQNASPSQKLSTTTTRTTSTTRGKTSTAAITTTTASPLPIVVPEIPQNLDPNQESFNFAASVLDYNIPTSSKQPPAPFSSVKFGADVEQPSIVLQPPLQEYIQYDTATTQGPPIYYEWKIPSNALEPPKFDSPIGVDGRTEPDYDHNYSDQPETSAKEYEQEQNQQLENGDFGAKLPKNNQSIENQNLTQTTFGKKPFSSTLATKSQRSIDSTTRSTTQRSTKDIKSKKTKKIDPDIQQLKRDLLIPEYLFPLENDGRTGYDSGEPKNSFQLKIPKRRNDNSDQKWYGENPDCPECHPSFVKPGTCEPCIKKR